MTPSVISVLQCLKWKWYIYISLYVTVALSPGLKTRKAWGLHSNTSVTSRYLDHGINVSRRDCKCCLDHLQDGRKWVFHVYGFQDTWVEGGGREHRCIEPQPGNQPRPAYVSYLAMSGEHSSIFCGAFFKQSYSDFLWYPNVMKARPVRVQCHSGL